MQACDNYLDNAVLNGGINSSRTQGEQCAIFHSRIEENFMKSRNLKKELAMKRLDEKCVCRLKTISENNPSNDRIECEHVDIEPNNRINYYRGEVNKSFDVNGEFDSAARTQFIHEEEQATSGKKESIIPTIQVTDEHSKIKEIQRHRSEGVANPAASADSDEDEDDLPVLDLCECGMNAVNGPYISPCYFCSYNQKRGRSTERRTSLALPGRFGGNALNGIRDRNRRASLHADFSSDRSSLSKGPPVTSDGALHNSRRGHSVTPMGVDEALPPENGTRINIRNSITIDDPNKEQMSTPVMIFCKHRLHKLSCSIPCAIGVTVLILGTKPKIFTFLNYFALLTVLVFYPLFGLLDTTFIYLRKRFFPPKPAKKEEENPPGHSEHIDNPPDLIPHRRQRSPSIISRISSFSTLPSITEEGFSEESEDGSVNGKGDPCHETPNGKKAFSPCEECLKEDRLGICTHNFKGGDGSVVVVM